MNWNEWLPALIVVTGTFVAAFAAKLALRRLSGLKTAKEIGPDLARLIYVVGFYLFIEAAPAGPRLKLWLGNIAFVAAVFIALGIIRRVVLIGIEWGLNKSFGHTVQAPNKVQQAFMPLIRNSVTLFVLFIGLIIVLHHFGIDALSLITTLGVGSLAVGFAAKDTLSNMISGFTLILDRNLHTGDRISLGEFTGRVDEIGLRTTQVRLDSGNTLIVPNSELANTKILNLSLPNQARMCKATVRISADHAFEQARRLVVEVLDQVGGINREQPQSVELAGVSDGLQALTVSYWIERIGDEERTISDFNQRLLERLAREGVRLHAVSFAKS